jgi:hypothetical protein
MSFSSDQQRKAVFAILKRTGGRKNFEQLLHPRVKLRQLRKAGFYPQYIQGRAPKHRVYATWQKGTNRYLHHIAWNYWHPGKPIKRGEEIHHTTGDRRENRKPYLRKLPRSVHSAIGSITKSYLRKPQYRKLKREKLDVLVLRRAMYLMKKKRR